MKAKNILSTVLLLFVAASVVALIVNRFRGGTAQEIPTDGVVVFYLHRNERCPTCVSIETCAKATVDNRFAKELKAGTLHWLMVNCDKPQNEHFREDFKIVPPVVVLVEMKDGKQGRWRSLLECMERSGDEADLTDYVQKEIEEFLKGAETT